MKVNACSYQLKTCVWEITLACCFSCRYCGSKAGMPRRNELTTSECLNIAKQIADMGCERVTLIGGEVFMRRDWHLIASELINSGVAVSIVTNGYLFSDQILSDLSDIGIESVAVSLDGPEKVHDAYRQKGSFKRAVQAIDQLIKKGIPVSVISTLHSRNINALEELYNILTNKELFAWQLQACTPMGNASVEASLAEIDFKTIIRFVEEHLVKAPFAIGVADNIGYFTEFEALLRGDLTGEITLFMGDFTYINYKDGDDSKYIVFNKEGKITAQSKDNESSEIICGGDGFYMVKIMERSIDVSQDTYGILNAQGKWLLEPTENLLYSNENGWGWMLEGGASYSYIGEGFFCAKWTPNTMGRNIPLHVIYNAKTDCWWDLYYDDSQESVILGAYNGSLIWEYTDIYGGYIYASDGEGNSQEIGEVGYASEFQYQDGLIHMTDDDGLNQYIDTEGRVIADYGSYVVITAFLDDNGRAAAVVYGKDSKCYLIGIIDNYKASSFDPIVIDATKEINFSDGVFSTYLPDDSDNKKYINVKGEILDDYPVNNDNTILFWWNYNSGFTNEQDEYICAFIKD